MQDDTAPTRGRSDSGRSTLLTFVVALLALAVVVAGFQFLPARSGTPAYAEGVTPTAEPTPYLEPVPNPPDPPLTNTSKLTAEEVRYVEDWLFYYVNQERIRRGIDPLVRHDGLDLIARNRSYSMGLRDNVTHFSQTGEHSLDVEFRKTRFDSCHYYGENIGATRYGPNLSEQRFPKTVLQIPKEAVRGFMYSTPHREAILEKDFEEVGIGAYAEHNWTYISIVFCNSGDQNGSDYYDRHVEPAIRHPEWLPKETREVILYDYDPDGSESVEPPAWLDYTKTLTPIPNGTG
ncbi:CAP domain-containing protein [Salinirubellus salinus]|uniref:CAP domain-containing protein n=1 Tax=Salinirubellus salinus TaxID=1364945 RepID=A0A9E7R4Y4_9EURY|nr:CAP domain-containing protein [Salinirubellus salinus]UWM55874.1 CAP domain-containing protein [Salinirubellus salinus]